MGYISSEVRAKNDEIINGLVSPDSMLRKTAAGNVNDYLRLRVREDGFARKVMGGAIQVTKANLDRQLSSAKPVIIRDVETNSSGAVSMPFGHGPAVNYIRGPRYPIIFNRIETEKYRADANELLTYDMDIRQMLHDFMLKDIMQEEDSNMMAVVNSIVGTRNVYNTDLAACRYVTAGPMSRAAIVHAKKGLRACNRNLNASLNLINHLTALDIEAFERNEVGGDLAQEIFINGGTERKVLGIDWAVTIKKDLVPTGSMFSFTERKFLGEFMVLDDVTMNTKTEAYWLEFFAYECVGGTIMNTAAVTRVDFTGSAFDWNETSAAS